MTWWDPSRLPLDVAPVGGLRQTALLEQGSPEAGGDAEHEAWRARRSEAVSRARRPSHRASTITALAHAPQEGEPHGESGEEAPSFEVDRTEVAREGRPRGPRFGTLVHAVLALCSLSAGRAELERVVASQALALGASPEEQQAAVEAAEAALAHPILQRAARSEDCRREVPLAMVDEDGLIAEGIADLVFREPEGGGYRIVDFKSDADQAAFAAYGRQLELYRRAIAQATGEPVLASLLRV